MSEMCSFSHWYIPSPFNSAWEIVSGNKYLSNGWMKRSMKQTFCTCFIFFNFILFLNFTTLYWFCQILKWIHHRYTCVPHPEPSSLLPPHTIPLGHPSAPAPSIQYRASNLDWQLIPYMILYVFQCHSPKSCFKFAEISGHSLMYLRV